MKYDSKVIFDTYARFGSYQKAGQFLGIDARTVKRHVDIQYDKDSTIAREAKRTGTPFDRVSHYWLKTKNKEGDDVSIFVKNQQDAMEYDELRERLINDLEQYAPKVPRIKYPKYSQSDAHILVLDPADVHIGKLANSSETGSDNYDIAEAVERVIFGVHDILAKTVNFNLEEIVLIVGNDIMHIDTPYRTTTAGTKQDTDGQWWEMFEAARNLYVDVIDACKEVAPVRVVFCPSNHDYMVGFGITDSIYSWYRNDENVNVSDYSKSMRHRKYIQYGNNLIGVTHGDGAKTKDLVTLMQYEAKQAWSQSHFSYWYIHHMHHKFRIVNGVEVEKDNIGVTTIGKANYSNDYSTAIECIRSPSPADGWHSRNGYVNLTAIEGFVHNFYEGQVARITSYC